MHDQTTLHTVRWPGSACHVFQFRRTKPIRYLASVRHLLLLLLLSPWATLGSSAQQVLFKNLTVDDGLSDNAITCLYEDREGYVWIGSEQGLDRYDGQTVLPVAGIREHVTSVLEGLNGTVWVTTSNAGLLELDTHTMEAVGYRRTAQDASSIASDQLTALYDLNDTTLLIGSREVSMIFMDKRTHRFTYWTDSTSIDPKLASDRPYELGGWCHGFTALGNGTLWISMLNNYASFVADLRSGAIVQVVNHRGHGVETMVTAAQLDGRVYTSGWQKGIAVLEKPRTTGPWVNGTHLPLDDEGLALTTWSNGRLVVGTRSIGLRIYDTRTGQVASFLHNRYDPSSLPSNRIRCLLADRSGTLWVGTTNGLAIHAPATWCMAEHELLPRDAGSQELSFHRLAADNDSTLRAFTSAGFYLLGADGSINHVPVLHNGVELQPTVIGSDGIGSLLLGTEYGLLHWDPRTQQATAAFVPYHEKSQHFKPGVMFQVRSLLGGQLRGRPVLHIGALGYHVLAVDPRTGYILGYPAPPGLEQNNLFGLVHDAVRDTHDRYWQATAGGVYRWDPDMPLLERWGDGDATADHHVFFKDRDAQQTLLVGDTLWVLLHEGAFGRIINDREERIAPPPYLMRRMLGFTRDSNGRFWATTTDGLLRFDPRTGEWLSVPVNDGLRFRKLSKAITAMHDGRIAFCADNTILTFDPRGFDRLPELPSLRITSTDAAGKPVIVHNGFVELPYSAPLIDIGVSALAHGLPRPLTFLYRLEGVEEAWRTLPKGEAIRYVGVPVGQHRLLVRSRDPFGRHSETQALLTITVSAPFWLSWWFYALIAVLISAGAFAWSRYRLAQALKLQGVRNRIASDLHDEVGSSLSSITIGSQLARQLSTGDNEQVKAILERIGETSSESLRGISDIVWAIDPKNDQGEALMKRMQRIANELLESKGIEVSFAVSGGVEELKLPMDVRKEIVLIYKEAVHNASKYSAASLVQVSLHRRNGSLAVSVKDDGTGFDPVLHPDGHGLGSMRRRANTLGAQFQLSSAPGLGTLVGLEVDLTRIRD